MCGGCDLQDIRYGDQLKLKKALFLKLAENFEALDIFKDIRIQVVPSPRKFRYRQRMDYVYSMGLAGLRKKNAFNRVVDLTECPITPAKMFRAFQRARELADKLGLESYDNKKHVGYLRYFVVRRTKKKEIMLGLVTKTDEREDKIHALAETLLKEKRVDSIHWMVHEGLSDISFGKPKKYFGKEYIEEKILGKKFLIGPNSFSQPNPYMAEKAYKLIRNHLRKLKPENLLDLYSGTASIAICVSDTAREITAVELGEENELLAKRNLERNKIHNIHFVRDDVKNFLTSHKQKYDAVIIDPPRTGLEPDACSKLLALAPKEILYMSCNPVTFIADMKEIVREYAIQSFRILDMFPQTKHMEVLAVLKRIQ
jgi:23S rRNA (uracil1939-C5)-methyltransferase